MLLLCYCYVIVMLLLLFCYCYVIVMLLLCYCFVFCFLFCYCYVIVMLLLFNYYFYCFTKIQCHVLPPSPPCLLSVSNAQSKSQRLNPGLFLVISEASSNCQLFEIDFFHFEGIT